MTSVAPAAEAEAGSPGGPPATPSTAWALVRLGLVLAAGIGLAYAFGVGETVILVLCLLVCVLLHELGHFVTAKAAGIKVTEFFVGFGPRLWSVRRGETEYGIKALPLGGYCRIIGMHNLDEVDPADEARTYRQAPVWRRLTVALAGSTVHFVIAFAVLFAMFAGPGDRSGYLPVPAGSPVTEIDALSSGASPAEHAGFHLGDRIVSVDGHRFRTFDQLRTFVEAHPGDTLTVVVDRRGHDLTLRPRTVNLQEVSVAVPGMPRVTRPTGFLGIQVSDAVAASPAAAVGDAGGDWVHNAALSIDSLGRLVTFHGISGYLHMLASPQAAAHPAPGAVRFESPVGVVELLHSAAGAGLSAVLYLLAVINLFLGIFNLVPLLPLDGGHVAIAVYEGLRSRRGRRYHADVAKLMPLAYAAILALVFIAASSLFLDLRALVA